MTPTSPSTSLSAHKQRDRMMASVNYDQPPGCSMQAPSAPLSPSLPTRPSVGGIPPCPCPCFSSPVGPCRCGAERHSLAITHLARPACRLQQLLVMVWRRDARAADRQHVYRPRHYAGLWKPIDPLASRLGHDSPPAHRSPFNMRLHVAYTPCSGRSVGLLL